jgi:hypothetical protein
VGLIIFPNIGNPFNRVFRAAGKSEETLSTQINPLLNMEFLMITATVIGIQFSGAA